jgi:hypothetical protein
MRAALSDILVAITLLGAACQPVQPLSEDPEMGRTGSPSNEEGAPENACASTLAATPDDMACNCSRRPGARRSFQCPSGLGEHAEATVGPQGGRVQLWGRQAKASGVPTELLIPPRALDRYVTIRITELDTIPDGLADLSPLYLFEPVDLAFATPVEARVPFGNGSGTVPTRAAMQWSSGAGFRPVPDSYDNAGFAQGSLSQLGWALVAEPAACAPVACRF